MKILKEKGNVKKLIQIADIHIRKNGVRAEEYEEVFEKLYDVLDKNREDALIVVCGDVFHEPITSEANSLVKKLFVNMSKYCDIIVFFGNHDQVSRNNSDLKDSLTSALEYIKTEKNLYILEKSGTYIYSNLAFGYTNIYDKSVYTIKDDVKNKIKVALWHGQFHGSKTGLGMVMESPKFNLEGFKDYDYALFGDIHLNQHLNSQKTFWYSGSMVQQDHGESVNKHGIMIHNLEKKTSILVELQNRYCFLTVNIKDNKVIDYDNELIRDKFVDLKIVYEGNGLEIAKRELDKIMKICNVTKSEIIKKTLEEYYINSQKTELEVCDNKSMIDKVMNYVNLLNKYDNVEKDKIKEILTEHAEKINYSYDKTTRIIKLKALAFNNYCLYGEGNCIDFTQLSGTVNITGKNGTGKSNLIDCLLYVIYGSTRSSNVDINEKLMNMECMGVFDINGSEYKIIRGCGFADVKASKKHFENIIEFYKDGIEIAKKDISMINNQILQLFGNKENFIRTYVMTQKKSLNFLDLTENAKTEYICDISNLDVYRKLASSLREEIKEKKSIITVNEKNMYIQSEDKKKSKIISLKDVKEEEIKKHMLSLSEMKKKQEELEHEYEKINREKILKEQQISNLDDAKNYITTKDSLSKNKRLLIDKKDTIIDMINDIEEKREKNKVIITDCGNKIKDSHEIEKNNINYENNKSDKIIKTNSEIEELLTKFVLCEKKFEEEKYDELKNKKSLCEKRRKNLEKSAENENNKIAGLEKQIEDYIKIKNIDEFNEKYEEMVNKLNTINDNENVQQITLNNINKKLKEQSQEAKKVKKIYVEKSKILESLNSKIKEYANIEEENTKYEEARKNKILKNRDKITMLMKQYEKNEENVLSIKELEKLKKSLEELKKNNKLKTKELNDFIKKNNIEEKKIKNIDCDMEKLKIKYNKYLQYKKELNDGQNNLNIKISYLDEIMEFLQIKKQNHKFNPCCEVCMSNKTTVNILASEKEIQEKENEIESIKKNLKEIKEKYISHEEYGIEYELNINIENENRAVQSKIDTLKNEISKAELYIEKNKIEIGKIEEQILKNDNVVKNNKKNKEITDSIEELKDSIDKLEKDKFVKYLEYLELTEDQKNTNIEVNEIAKFLKQCDLLESEKDKCVSELEKLEKKRNEIYNKYSKYKGHGEKKVKYEKNFNELEECKKTLILLKSQNDYNNKEIEVYEKEIKEYEKIKNVSHENEKLEKLINVKKTGLEKTKKSKNDEYEKYIFMKKKADIAQTDEFKLNLELNKLEKQLELIEKDIQEKEVLIKRVKEYEKETVQIIEIDEIYRSLKSKKESLKSHIETIEKNLSKFESEKEILIKLEKENTQLEKEKTIIDSIADMISEGYIDNLLSSSLIPEMCETVNSILSKFFDFKIKMEYEKKKIFVSRVNDNKFCQDVEKLSGCEYSLTNIIFRLAIHGRNKLFKPNFLIIDEGFVYCDDNKVIKLEELFRYFEKVYDFVLIVTHDNTLASYAKTTMLKVLREGGFSKVVHISDENKYKSYMDMLERASMKKPIKEKEEINTNYKKINKKINSNENDSSSKDDGDETINLRKRKVKKTIVSKM